VCPTGTGKSGIAACLPYVMKVARCLVISPSLTITEQLREAFTGGKQGYETAFLVKCGIVDVDSFKDQAVPTEFVVDDCSDVSSECMLQYSLIVTNAHKFPGGDTAPWSSKFPMDKMDLVIVDEAHHFPAGLWDGIVQRARECSKKVRLSPHLATCKNARVWVCVCVCFGHSSD
jgi:DNA repair protein RadD